MDAPTPAGSKTQSLTQSRTFVSTIALVAVILVIGGSWYGWGYQSKLKQERFLAEYKEVDSRYHRTGEYDQAISSLEKLQIEAESLDGVKDREAYTIRVSLRLAANYIGRNQPGDRDKAIDIYRSIVDDQKFSTKLRANALAEMASLVHWTGSDEESKQLLFSKAPYDALLKEQGGDVHAAVVKLYEMSDALYPNALSKFQIALMASTHLVNMAGMTEEQKVSMAKSIYQGIQDGDTLIASNVFVYENGYLAHMYYCRAMSLAAASRIIPSVVTSAMVEESFKKAMELSADHPEDFYSRSVGILARMNYASYLNNMTAKSSVERASDIKELLSVYNADAVTNADLRLINNYMLAVGVRPDTDFFKGRAKKLATVSENFKAYLEALNWKLK